MNSRNKIPEALNQFIKSSPQDLKSAEKLIKRARKDLSSAQFIRTQDLEAAYTLLYDSMLHAALAYMAISGVRPDVRGKHKTVIQYMSEVLGKKYADQLNFYDRMRRTRHQLIYEPGFHECTEKEIEESSRTAKDFVNIVTQKIKEEHPQKEFDF